MTEVINMVEFAARRGEKMDARFDALMDKAEQFSKEGKFGFRDKVLAAVAEMQPKRCRNREKLSQLQRGVRVLPFRPD